MRIIGSLGAPLLVGSLLALTGAAVADDWPQWRGPLGNGVSPETGLPTEWGPETNVAWKARLGGLGVSSPIVLGERVFVTSQQGAGVLEGGTHPTLARGEGAGVEKPLGEGVSDEGAAGDGTSVTFLVEAFHREDGRRLWRYALPSRGGLPPVHSKHNLASPSPVSDGERVYAWFGTGQLVALDMEGQLVWERHLGEELGPFSIRWGHSASPTLANGLLVLLCDHDLSAVLLAVDARTGEDRWRVDRGKGLHSYSTPFVVRGTERTELVVNSSERVEAFDPRSGERLWWIDEPNRFPIPAPSYADGILYMSRGYRSGPYMAVRTGGSGEVSESHVLWRVPTGAPYISSLVYTEGLVYMANGNGIVTAVDGVTGQRMWQERVGGVFSASPVAGDGKVYLLAESGETVVLAAGKPELEILARNAIEERTVASPAISNGQIFLRGDEHLVAIGSMSERGSRAENEAAAGH